MYINKQSIFENNNGNIAIHILLKLTYKNQIYKRDKEKYNVHSF